MEVPNTTRGADLALINAAGYSGDENALASVYFEKGDSLANLTVAQRISAVCGPLVLLGDHSGEPVLITPDADVAALHADWTARIIEEDRRYASE